MKVPETEDQKRDCAAVVVLILCNPKCQQTVRGFAEDWLRRTAPVDMICIDDHFAFDAYRETPIEKDVGDICRQWQNEADCIDAVAAADRIILDHQKATS